MIVGLFFFQCVKLRFLELYCNLFTKFCDVNEFEEVEINTDSLYQALAQTELKACIRHETQMEWHRLRSNDSVASLIADAVGKILPPNISSKTQAT